MMTDNSKALLFVFLALLRCCFECFYVRMTRVSRMEFLFMSQSFSVYPLFEINKMDNVYSFTVAAHGFLYYRKFWKPKKN